jgi:hypothetical protein
VKKINWSRITLLSRFLLGSGIILLNSILSGQSYSSKWTRVDALAKSLTNGEAWTREEAARKLQVKEEIIEILYAQETGYPLYYVDSRAMGSRNGSSWQNAFTKIQDAVDAAHNGGEGWVWVAAGSYTYQTETRGWVSIDGYTLKGVIQLLPKVMQDFGVWIWGIRL